MIVLMICDGWGLSEGTTGNAISLASTPNMDRWMRDYPWTQLQACCKHVGLPPGQMGNSEVGHLNIGAGRVVLSPLMRVNDAIEKGTFQSNEVLLQAMLRAKTMDRPIHLLGMLSDGGVHSHQDHLFTLIEMANTIGNRIAVHVLLDGRDTEPEIADEYLRELEEHLEACSCGRIADIAGRYYSMDRDKRWERTKLGYDAIVRGEGLRSPDARSALREAYDRGKGDEFVTPTLICPKEQVGENGEEKFEIVTEDLIRDGDEVIFFNFRPDRARQLSHALLDEEFTEFNREEVRVHLTSMMKYEETLNSSIVFPPMMMENVLGEVLSDNGLRQLRITETEKFAHVTFFFNGGREEPFPGEDRVLIPSPKVATYDLQPEMSAPLIVEELLPRLSDYDVVIMNFANADMVGHTGFMGPTIEAVETVDRLAGQVVEEVLKQNGTALITADHGNAESTQNEDGSHLTAHTLNPVPLIWISRESEKWKNGTEEKELLPLAGKEHAKRTFMFEGAITGIAPTILRLLGVPIPKEMTSSSLIPEEFFKSR
jgi:2,3-bisphosphoglycerate-independent phosphoglycerate mutase